MLSLPGLTGYTGDKFPRWKNNPFVGAMTTQLARVAFNQPSQAERREGLLVPLRIRIRDVQQSPDGYIYGATEGAIGGNTRLECLNSSQFFAGARRLARAERGQKILRRSEAKPRYVCVDW